MKLITLLVIFIIYLFITGIWTMYSATAYKKAYNKLKQGDETYLDFLAREVGSPKYVIARKLKLHWWYKTKMEAKFTRLIGFIEVVLSILMIIAIIFVFNTEYKVLLFLDL